MYSPRAGAIRVHSFYIVWNAFTSQIGMVSIDTEMQHQKQRDDNPLTRNEHKGTHLTYIQVHHILDLGCDSE